MLQLKVITPAGEVLSVNAESVTAPGAVGEFQVLPQHLPALSLLGGGALRYTGADQGVLYIRGGVAEVSADGAVVILAEETQKPDALDLDRARSIKTEAEAALASDEYLNDERLERIRHSISFAEAVLNA